MLLWERIEPYQLLFRSRVSLIIIPRIKYPAVALGISINLPNNMKKNSRVNKKIIKKTKMYLHIHEAKKRRDGKFCGGNIARAVSSQVLPPMKCPVITSPASLHSHHARTYSHSLSATLSFSYLSDKIVMSAFIPSAYASTSSKGMLCGRI